MILGSSASVAAGRRKPIDVHGQTYFLSGYVGYTPVRGTYVEGNESNDDGQPQGFLVEQPPGSVTPPHFHEVDQFQVFVGGDGRIGKHDARPVSVHFAAGHTPYGPIVAGESGVSYFSLRAGFDPGAKYMPAQRSKLRPGPRRFRLSEPVAAEAPDRVTADSQSLIQAEPDGLEARIVRLKRDGRTSLPAPSSGAGQYLVVISGSLVQERERFEPLSCLFVTADEPPMTAIAGPDGLELLVLQFPKP